MTYDYRCEDCGAIQEVWATLAEKERGLQLKCSKCGGTRLAQVFTAVNVITRSSGGSQPPQCGPASGAGCCR